MKRKVNSKLSLLLAVMLLLVGCGGASSNKSAMDMATTESATATGWASDAKAEPVEEAETESGAGSAEMSENDLANRKLIKTVYLDMETENFDQLKQDLEAAIDSHGGYIESSHLNTPKSEYIYRSYDLTIRIPTDKLNTFIETVGTLGYITSKNENIDDVTLTYVDMTAYKEAMETEYDKVMELLESATELDQILILESKLSELRYEINSYESQLRTYDNLIDYSTIHLYVAEVRHAIEADDSIGSRISSGFLNSLYSVRDFFVDLFVAFVSNLPVLVVLGVFIALLILILRKIVKAGNAKRELKKKHNTFHYTPDSGYTQDTTNPSHVQEDPTDKK